MIDNTPRGYIRYLPFYGCMSTGIIYLGIGVVAILSFLKLKEGGADESSLLAFLNEYIVGKVFVWIVLLGTISYIAWRIYEAIADPYRYGSQWAGKAKRIAIALSTVADIVIAFSAVRILFGTSDVSVDGQPREERQIVGDMLHQPWGKWVVILIGLAICVTALVQFIYGIRRGYRERLNMSRFNTATKTFVHVLAWVGYFARGVILGIIGFFFIKSGISENAAHVVNTDKAFDFIGDHVGHAAFILVAAGTICYALFMFALGITYNTEKG
jgi:hypothetical protein